ncbi:hypothetical protein B0I26_104115 [Anoxybacillus vitaminiphilus]|uniref:Sporulation lipoprotein YhcN/YlaJ n=1 Tax=Paranoxybacillus vitaminiphilus TaxID=581036 RepID=A0A327YHQ7_9BACL|nr:hypothetical protein [Anoxybacillus vitaminiphilus]RAK20463.1 hypothetical protein B0I26_104115 [Anoxybacillus vitaminiphilus]
MRTLLPFFVFILLSACAVNPNRSDYEAQSLDKDGTKLMTYDKDNKAYRRYLEEDFYNDFAAPEKTNQNPNFISLTEGSANNRADVNQIAQAIEKYTDYRPGSIWLNGRDAWVTVHATKNVSRKQREKDRDKIYKTLTRAMPRYHIHLNMD